jgi:hypothetical protein
MSNRLRTLRPSDFNSPELLASCLRALGVPARPYPCPDGTVESQERMGAVVFHDDNPSLPLAWCYRDSYDGDGLEADGGPHSSWWVGSHADPVPDLTPRAVGCFATLGEAADALEALRGADAVDGVARRLATERGEVLETILYAEREGLGWKGDDTDVAHLAGLLRDLWGQCAGETEDQVIRDGGLRSHHSYLDAACRNL